MADTYQAFWYGAEKSAGQGGLGQLVTDLAVLVADAGSPTQAHVTTVAEDLSVMLGAASSNTAGGPTQAAILVVIDTTVIPNVSALRSMFNRILAQAAGSMLP